MKTDGAVYFNAGTVTSCNFDVQGTIGAGGVGTFIVRLMLKAADQHDQKLRNTRA